MSVDRIAALEQRLAELEGRLMKRRALLRLLFLGLALTLGSQGAGIRAQGTAEVLTVKAPFRVVNALGEVILSVEQGGGDTRLHIINQNKAVATLSGGSDTAVLALSGSQGIARMAMNFDGPGTGPSLQLQGGSGEVLGVGTKAVSIKAPVTVTPSITLSDRTGAEVARLAVPASGRVAFTLGDGRRGGLAAGVASSGMGFLSIRDQQAREAIAIGAYQSQGRGLYVLGPDGDNVHASLGLDEDNDARLQVGTGDGAGIIAGLNGQGDATIGLFDAKHTARIGLIGGDTQGQVFVTGSNTAGANSVILTGASTLAGIYINNKSGFASVQLEGGVAGNGSLKIGDAAGNTMVEAGTTTDGLGIVRAGPRLGGTTGISQGGLVLPFAIMGQKGK